MRLEVFHVKIDDNDDAIFQEGEFQSKLQHEQKVDCQSFNMDSSIEQPRRSIKDKISLEGQIPRD